MLLISCHQSSSLENTEQVNSSFVTMETCVNCACQLYDVDSCKNEDLKVFNVYTSLQMSLSSIYKLNYLSLFLDSPHIENENQVLWKLCENCLETFNSLLHFYEDFNQLRSLESKLAMEIQKLDDCILENSQQQKQKPTEQNEEKKEEEEPKISSSLFLTPIVVLQRLENDPVAQKFLSNSNGTRKESVKRTIRKSQSKKRMTRKPKVINHVSFSKSKVVENDDDPESSGHVKEIKVENDNDDDDENMDSFCDGDDPLFIPSPNSEKEEEIDKEDDDNDDEYIPKAKKQKKETNRASHEKTKEVECNDTQKVKRKVNRSEKAYAKLKAATLKRRNMINRYQKRKTQVPNPCWECSLDFPTQKDCYDHTMKEHLQPGESVCKNCAKRCKSKYGLKCHEKLLCPSLLPGELLPIWACKTCENEGKISTFAMKKHYTDHLKKVHDARNLTCEFPDCIFSTDSPSSLYNHIKTQHDEAFPFPAQLQERTCEMCEKIFKTKSLFKYHYKVTHLEEGVKKYKAELKRAVAMRKQKREETNIAAETFCSECMVDLLTRRALVRHQRSLHVDPESKFVCEQCGKRFSHNWLLTNHKNNVHSEQRIFCEKCSKSFKTLGGLQTHLHVHDEESKSDVDRRRAMRRLVQQQGKIRREALAQSLAAGIPQFTGAQFTDLNNSGSSNDVANSNTNTTD